MKNETSDPLSFQGFGNEIKLVYRSARQVWALIARRQKLILGLAAVLMAAVSACNISFPVLMGRLVDGIQYASDENRAAIWHSSLLILLWIAGLYLAREFLQIVRRAFVESACTGFEQQLSVRMIEHLMKAELAQLSQETIGSLHGRLTRSVVGTVRFVRLILLECLPPFVTGGFAVVVALRTQPVLALVMVGVVPISLWLTVRQLASQKGIRLELIRGREQIDGTLTELLGGIDYVRAAHTEDRELRRFDEVTRNLRHLEKRHHFDMSLYGAARALNEGVFHILVLGLGIHFALTGHITYGDILTFSILFLTVMAPLNEVHRALDEGHECSLQVEILQSMLGKPPDRSYAVPHSDPPRLEAGQPLVHSEELIVDYETPVGSKRALDRISLRVRHGETIGLAGPSGCGKTTFLKILLRLAHPTSGRVTVGQTDLDQLSRADIGRLIGYVGQNPFVIRGTVAENITYGVKEASPEQIEAAARLAGIHDEIAAMPGGYEAQVLERGSNLSGGQRQRLALARVFLKNPPIIILDEGTSALDSTSERHVKQAIDFARADRTVVLVAHRLTTLRDVDRILVFHAGRIVEEGTYAELASQDGVFAELIRSAEADS